MKDIILLTGLVVLYFSVSIYGFAWLSHEYNQHEIEKVPLLEDRINNLQYQLNHQDKIEILRMQMSQIMHSAIKGL